MEYIIITFAVVLMDVGIYVFKFPNNFSFGGVSGMAVVFSHFIPMTSAQINLVINLILLVIGFIVLGRDFGVKTAYVTVVSSLLLNVFEKIFPMDRALTGNIMLELCFAIILPAVAAALLFFENASGGGTDIVAMIIKKYSTMNISGALFAVDCVIVVVSFMVFDLTTGLCSVLGLMAKTLLIDKSIERMKLNKYFTIISSKPDEICEFIMNGLERSATVYHGEGVYSHKDKKIILTVVDVRQAVLLQRFIDDVEAAFVGGIHQFLVTFIVGPFFGQRTFGDFRVDFFCRRLCCGFGGFLLNLSLHSFGGYICFSHSRNF